MSQVGHVHRPSGPLSKIPLSQVMNVLGDILNGDKKKRPRPDAQSWTKPKKSRTAPKRIKNVESNGDNVQTGGKRSGKKIASKSKGNKSVKVPAKLRKQVKQVLTNNSPRGYYQERFYFKYTPLSDQQTNYDLGKGYLTGQNASASGVHHFFDPCRVLDAASVLFNWKTLVAQKGLTDTNSFPTRTIQINVVRQWVQMEFKNLTARRMTCKLYTWELKNDAREDATLGGVGQFSDAWTNAFLAEADATFNDGRLNIAGATPNTIGATPQLSPRMKRQFNMEEKIIDLEAGKTYYHTIQGPRKLYDFAKFWERGVFVNDIKGVKGCCLVMIPDTVTHDTGGAGQTNRSTAIAAADPYGICVETIYNYVIQMPEQAGFVLTTTTLNTPVPLRQRRDHPYVIKKWNDIQPTTGGEVEIDDENPQNKATVGL